MDGGNEYENTSTYVVMPNEARPPVGSEGVIVVQVESSDDHSDRTVTNEHERVRKSRMKMKTLPLLAAS